MDANSRPTELDSRWVQPPTYGRVDRFWLERINDKRDLRLVYVALRISLMIMPPALLLFAWGSFPWWLGALYVAYVLAGFAAPYVLMLHCVSHRPLFKRKQHRLAHWIPVVMAPFFGQSPYTYYAHHMGMHHPENNLYDDHSSTMKYQRDSFGHFLLYWLDFFFLNPFKVPRYLASQKRDRMLKRYLVGDLGWFAAAGLGLALAPWPTFWVFVLPFLLMRFLMMCGNWGQHAFVDADDPNNPYKNSVTLTNARHNRRCYNDGYHVVHHLKPALHWSKMADHFTENFDEYARNDAIVLDGIHTFQAVWNLVMRKRLDILADHMVDFPGHERTQEEKIALLESRLRPIGRTEWNTTPALAREHAAA